jgi:DNA-directed RNA polymerase subunit beta
VKYLVNLSNQKAEVDDIDHLSNRRVRTVGEQLYAQFGVGLARMARTIRERMNVRDNEVFTPIDLINAEHFFCYQLILRYFTIISVLGSNQSLGEITNKRRVSALGPGGLIERACRF